MNILKSFLEHRNKFLLWIFSGFIFLFLLFPFDDLGDLVSSQVSKLTDNSIYLRFDKLNMSLFPQPGFQFNQVYIENVNTPPLSAQELTITPSISGLIRKKPYGHVSAVGLFKGNVDLSLGSGSRTESGLERHKVEIKAKKLNLQNLRELVGLPVPVKGQLDIEVKNAQADISFVEQPEADVVLQIHQFELPTSNLPTQMGTLTLPELKLSNVELKGRLSGGKLNTTGFLGQEGDEIYGTVKVNLGLPIQNLNGLPSARLGAYVIELDIVTKRPFQEKAALFLSFLESYKQTLPDGAQYKLKISGNGPNAIPSISALR